MTYHLAQCRPLCQGLRISASKQRFDSVNMCCCRHCVCGTPVQGLLVSCLAGWHVDKHWLNGWLAVAVN